MSGKKIGIHRGLPLYTIGQRKGVEIGGNGPYYVASQDYKTNTLYVVKDGNDSVLYGDKLFAADVNWIAGKAPKFPLKCEAVIRYRHKPVKCVARIVQKLTSCPILSSRARPGIQEGVAGTLISKRSYQYGVFSGLPWIAGQARNDKKDDGTRCYSVKLSTPQRAITPGQSVVFYRGKEVLGGGIIHRE